MNEREQQQKGRSFSFLYVNFYWECFDLIDLERVFKDRIDYEIAVIDFYSGHTP